MTQHCTCDLKELMLVVEKQWMYGIRKYWIGDDPKGNYSARTMNHNEVLWVIPLKEDNTLSNAFCYLWQYNSFRAPACCPLGCLLVGCVKCSIVQMIYPEPDRKQEKCFLQLNCSCNEIISIKPPFQAGILRSPEKKTISQTFWEKERRVMIFW